MTNGVVSARGGRLQKYDLKSLVMENRKFTNTAIPVLSGTEGWYQHIHIVQAIVKSNGWPEETAALQLFVHCKRGGIECGSPFGKKGTGVMDRTGGRTGGILPIAGQAGGPEKAVRERVLSTGIGSSYIRNRSRNVGDPRVWRYEGASARYDDKG